MLKQVTYAGSPSKGMLLDDGEFILWDLADMRGRPHHDRVQLDHFPDKEIQLKSTFMEKGELQIVDFQQSDFCNQRIKDAIMRHIGWNQDTRLILFTADNEWFGTIREWERMCGAEISEGDVANNPPWADKILEENWDALEDRFSGRWQVMLPQTGYEYGCGHYGCVYATGEADVVCKVTTEEAEAYFVGTVLLMKKLELQIPEGLVNYEAVFKLHGEAHKEKDGFRDTWTRPAFILWREELPIAGFDDIEEFLKQGSDFDTEALDDFRSQLIETTIYGSDIMGRVQRIHKTPGSYNEHWDRIEALLSDYEYSKETFDDLEAYSRRVHAAWKRGEKGHYDPPPEHIIGNREASNELWRYRRAIDRLIDNKYGKLVGETMLEFFNRGIVFGDVHYSNVGLQTEDLENPKIIIFDPGWSVIMNREWSVVEVEEV